MGVIFNNKTNTINESINSDPNLIVWLDDIVSEFVKTLYCWQEVGDITKNDAFGGVKFTSEISLSQVLPIQDLYKSNTTTFTGYVDFASPINNVTMTVNIDGTDFTHNSTADIDAHIFTFDLSSILSSTSQKATLTVTATPASEIENVLKYIKLEKGSSSTISPIRTMGEEINKYESVYAGDVVGIYGRSLMYMDITGQTISLNDIITGMRSDILQHACRTDEGTVNITNLPPGTPSAFILKTEMIQFNKLYIQTIHFRNNNMTYQRTSIDGVISEWKNASASNGIVDSNSDTVLEIWTGTVAQYDALVASGLLKTNTIYVFSGDSGTLLATLDSSKKLNETQIPDNVLTVVNESTSAIGKVSFVINADNSVSIRW